MKTIVKIGYILLSILFLVYLSIPTLPFPNQIPDSLQSNEPADMETPLRRGYYTDSDRKEILDFYQKQFEIGIFKNIPLTYRLNYPPEDAQTLIRDQTKSSYLEEVVHPLRESVFVNGFVPKQDKDKIIVNGKKWYQKIILRQVPSNTVLRLLVGVLAIILLPVLANSWVGVLEDLARNKKKLWSFR